MADEAQKILQQMQQDRNDKKPVDPTEFYTKLRIYKGRRRALPFVLGLCFLIIGGMISTSMILDHHWLTILGPIMIIGTFLTLLPPTEEWIYTPWQSSSQKYERHFTE